MRKPSRREVLATLLFVFAASLAATLSGPPMLRGWSVDALTAFALLGSPREASSQAVVIALDEETSNHTPFQGAPLTTWTPEIARVVDAVIESGALVVGFDVVFANSMEESQIRFGPTTVGDALRGFDRAFLRSLSSAASQGKLVLGEAQIGDRRIRPFAGQRFAIGPEDNIRPLNVITDPDGVVRRVPSSLGDGARKVASFSVELASRAKRTSSLVSPSTPLLLNFATPPPIPTFSLGDLDACIDAGDKDFLRRAFGGKVVLIGTQFAAGDQLATSRRLSTRPVLAMSRCAGPSPRPVISQRRTLYGTYVQATAVENLLRGDALRDLGDSARDGLNLVAATAGVGLAAALAPGLAALALLASTLCWCGFAIFAFSHALALPLFEPIFAATLALGAMIAYRLGVVDREKRLLKRAFGFYLAPSLIDKLASGAAPALGGETREVTIFFSDVSGFSGLSEAASPREIVALMNEYFTLMSDAIEDAGGYVDKYVGDAVVALFGAPAPAQDHAVRAVTAALACRDRLAAFNAGRAAPIRHRIGINSGEALIGNVGSKRRFNFTAFGDNVNLAARIEELGSTFAAEILVSEQVRARAENGFVWREIDTVRVRGRERTVTLYEPLAKRGELAPDRQARANSYAAGLAAWRRGDFASAAELFEVHAAADPPSARFLARCRAMIGSPPLGDWLVYHQQGR